MAILRNCNANDGMALKSKSSMWRNFIFFLLLRTTSRVKSEVLYEKLLPTLRRVKYCMKSYNLEENANETQLHIKCALRKVDVSSLLWKQFGITLAQYKADCNVVGRPFPVCVSK